LIDLDDLRGSTTSMAAAATRRSVPSPTVCLSDDRLPGADRWHEFAVILMDADANAANGSWAGPPGAVGRSIPVSDGSDPIGCPRQWGSGRRRPGVDGAGGPLDYQPRCRQKRVMGDGSVPTVTAPEALGSASGSTVSPSTQWLRQPAHWPPTPEHERQAVGLLRGHIVSQVRGRR
jgi:hypothetical protein